MSLRRRMATLLREAVPDFSWRSRVDARREAVAGMAGAVLVIPQAITFAYLVGLPPEYGLYCAVFVAFIASLFGSSAMVGGPNTAVSILLCLTVLPYAGRGSPLYIEYVLILSFMVGAIQLVIWLLRGAALFRYFSPAAITGIKAGVGILLITSAIEGSFGLSPLTARFFYEKFSVALGGWGEFANGWALLVSAITIVSGLLMRRRWPRMYIVGAVLVGTVAGLAVIGWLGPVDAQVELLGHVVSKALPIMVPAFGPQHWVIVEGMFPNAVAIAVLGLAQSLVIVRDLKAQGHVDLHKETFAQGLSNLVSPFFSTFAGSGSFNRTSVAVQMGARTPLSGMVSAVAVAFIACLLGPFFTYLPMPAIAGVLALVGIGMVQWKEMRPLLRERIEASVYLMTLFAVTFLGLEVGILVAAALSAGFFIASASKVDLEIVSEGEGERIAVTGNLFYASIDRLSAHLRKQPQAATLLDLSRVSYCDATARALFETIRRERKGYGGRLDIVPA